MGLKEDAAKIISYAIKAADPYESTLHILKEIDTKDKQLTVLSIGKASVPMAKAAESVFSAKIKNGLIITKYGHTGGYSSELFSINESAHPISDDNSVKAAETALSMCRKLDENDLLLVLLSGGGSALFEKSSIPFEMQKDITKKLLARGADIEKINMIRRRISLVKGGKLAAAAFPASVCTVALSDVLSNDKCAIASGVTVCDTTPDGEVLKAVNDFLPEYYDELKCVINNNSQIKINDSGYFFAGDVNLLCNAAEHKAEQLGYTVVPCSRQLTGEARDTARKIIQQTSFQVGKKAFIYAGETTVTLKGNGLGGRNQEMALSAAIELKGKSGVLFASVGSDGTDGPTDAAGGIVDGLTYEKILDSGMIPEKELDNNNSYYALQEGGGLVITGPTGTNVNDLTFVLINK